MSDPFLGEVRLMAFNFPPKGWALANGQLLPINQNQALFSILGTTYGGNGQTTFALPNLQGRVPTHTGNGLSLGQSGGEVAHTLSLQELPTHQHMVNATSAAATTGVPGSGVVLATSVGAPAYAPPSNVVAMDPGAVQTVGGSQPHENRQPYLTVSFCIALVGIFPSQN
jgi:microcystin-dependent protein